MNTTAPSAIAHEGTEWRRTPERGDNRERHRKPECSGTPVEDEAPWVRVTGDQLVDEPTCSGLVRDRQTVRRLRGDAPGDPQDRVERGVGDQERNDQHSRERGRTVGDTLHEQPEHEAQPHDEEELRDVQVDEVGGLVAQLGVVGGMQEAEEHIEGRDAE